MFVPLWLLVPGLIVVGLLFGAAARGWDEDESDEPVGDWQDWVEESLAEGEYIPDETDLDIDETDPD